MVQGCFIMSEIITSYKVSRNKRDIGICLAMLASRCICWLHATLRYRLTVSQSVVVFVFLH